MDRAAQPPHPGPPVQGPAAGPTDAPPELTALLGRPIREILAEMAGISERDWRQAQEYEQAQRRNPPRPEWALVELGLLDPALLARAQAARWGLRYVSLDGAVPDPSALEAVSAETLGSGLVLPLEVSDRRLLVAIADPDRLDVRDRLVQDAGPRRLELVVASAAEIRSRVVVAGDGADAPASAAVEAEDDAPDLVNAPPVVRLVAEALNRAIAQGASDIHLGDWGDGPEARYRLDGRLRPALPIPPRLYRGVVSRLKVLAKLDIAEHRLPQDGEISWAAPTGRRWDLRVATLPARRGEHVVVRIFGHSVGTDLADLGFSGEVLAALEALVHTPHGIILVTGPTGSGKSTTLATMLRRIQQLRPDDAIYTVEDPVEIQIPGAVQVQVLPKAGLTFPKVLRTLLRADPDVVEIGEIRDSETAQIAVQAALTGHLVLSTLHTNDAPGAVVRLVDMGVQAWLLREVLRAVLAQRLVRRVCRRCSTVVELSGADGYLAPGVVVAREHRGAGCPACHGGYRGRVAIAELLVLTPQIAELVGGGGGVRQIREAARMRSLVHDGADKIARGLTTVAEVRRVTALDTDAEAPPGPAGED
jgi:type II secretory ATPase GspE/PulE/Tfp pilus assembly ATPase PilB-like protein